MDFSLHDKITLKNLKVMIEKGKSKGFNLDDLGLFLTKKQFKKRVVFIGGKQISGSLSPIMHTLSSLAYKGQEFLYTLLNLQEKPDLEVILDEIETNNHILGANVTMPYKEDIFGLLKAKNKLDNSAIFVGAVNTIVKKYGNLRGYNTDIDGIIGPIKSTFTELELSKIKKGYILGSGGAARASISAFLALGITDITIFNRKIHNELQRYYNSNKIKKILKNEYGIDRKIELSFVEYDVTNDNKNKISLFLKERGILINTLPFAFKDNLPKKPIIDIEFEKIKDNIVLYFDIIYDMNYLSTPLMDDFAKIGIKTCSGVDMLIAQALKGFYLWTSGKTINKQKIEKLLK